MLSSTWRYDFEQACECIYNTGLSRDIKIIGATHIKIIATPIYHQVPHNVNELKIEESPKISNKIKKMFTIKLFDGKEI